MSFDVYSMRLPDGYAVQAGLVGPSLVHAETGLGNIMTALDLVANQEAYAEEFARQFVEDVESYKARGWRHPDETTAEKARFLDRVSQQLKAGDKPPRGEHSLAR